MTISTTTSVVTYQGNGATTAWTFSFVGDNTSYIEVFLTSNGVTTGPLAANQYGIVLNSVPVGGIWGIGGTVTYPLSGTPLQAGTYITIARAVPYEQNISISNQGAFYPQAIEQALDVLELQIQQLVTGLSYTLSVPIEDVTIPNVLPPAALRANGYLAFDANGQPIILFNNSGGVTPTPGSFALLRKVSTTGTATIPMFTTDSFGGLAVYQSTSPVTTVQLPTGLFGPYPIVDGSGNAGSFPITVLPPTGKTINGQSSYILAFNFQSITVGCDSSGEFFVL